MRAHEFIPEKINPETIQPGFERVRRMKNGYVIRARAKDLYDDGGIEIEVFDPQEDPELRWPIADVRFKVKHDDTGEPFLASLSTGTKERYRRQGLAAAMYNFARMLGNEVRPSRLQTDQGRAFWQGGAGAGRELELTDEPVYQAPTPSPKAEPEPEPRPRGFLQRWRRLLMPDLTAQEKRPA